MLGVSEKKTGPRDIVVFFFYKKKYINIKYKNEFVNSKEKNISIAAAS